MRKRSKIQSILFDKEKWSVTAARHWLQTHSKAAPKADTTENYHRFRQSPPFNFTKGSLRTITLSAPQGIKAIIGVERTRTTTKKAAARTRVKRPAIRSKIKVNPRPKVKAKRPWLPTMLVDIATALSIDLESGDELKFPIRGDFALCSNKSGSELWIVSRKGSKKIDTTNVDSRAEKLYETFTGFEHDSVGNLVHVRPREFTKIGRAMAIVYRSDKFAKPGKTSDYIHSFRSYPSVSVDDPKRPKIVALRGGQIKIKKEGITG
jgi:hypothetical protein